MHDHDLHQRPNSDADAAGDRDRAVNEPFTLHPSLAHKGGESKPTLGIIGAGKVGSALARLSSARGYTVASVFSRNEERRRTLAERVGALAASTHGEAAALADLTILAVPDDALDKVVANLASVLWTGKGVVHTSGVHGAATLALLASRGAMIGGLHPAFPFADVEIAVERLPGATFAVEAEEMRLRDWLFGLVVALDGRVLDVPPGSKPLYHAALVIASNYTVTLYAAAERLLLGLGADRAAADAALNALVDVTIENLRRQGVPDALTGPLVRADVGTITAHLGALKAADPALEAVYRALARLTYPLMEARGVPLDPIEHLLRQEDNNAIDDT